MLMFYFAIFILNRSKGTSNVLKEGGGGSAEYGQRPHFYIFCGPFPKSV